MDGARFDQFTRGLGVRLPRRVLVGVLATAGLSLARSDAHAKRKKKCKAPKRKCGKRCVAVLTDPRHCGTCGRTCATGERCTSGTCSLPCPPGQKGCAGKCIPISGCCANTECPAALECEASVCLNNTCRMLSVEDETECFNLGAPGQCRGGGCINCLRRREVCLADGDCCDSRTGRVICESSLHVRTIACADDTLRCCGMPGATCQSDCDCCEGSDCQAGRCCRVSGKSCALDNTCCSGNCASSVCA